MSTIIIYQIGRLDTNTFDNLKFEIENQLFETNLSSFAIKQYLNKKGFQTKVILLYPVSLPFNSVLINNERFKSQCSLDCYNKLKSVLNNPNSYLNNPSDFFKHHPHTKEAEDHSILHSLGKYKTLSDPVEFDCYYQDIVLMILIDMIKRYIENEDEIQEIIIDISSGHNIYISALIEAFRYLGTWIKLYKWNRDRPSLKVAFSDPIIHGFDSFKIQKEDLKFQAFFSSPVKYEDIENFKLAKDIYPEKEQRDNKRVLNSVLECFVLTFSAIKNNTPLAIYTFGYHEKEKILEVFNTYMNNTLKKLNQSYRHSPNFDKSAHLKVIVSFGLYLGLSDILQAEAVFQKEEVESSEIREKFKRIYEIFKLGLNDTILGNEIDKLQKEVRDAPQWSLLHQLLYDTTKESSPQQRNFFAHAGFEANITQCQKRNSKIYLRYEDNEEKRGAIKAWLKKAV